MAFLTEFDRFEGYVRNYTGFKPSNKKSFRKKYS